MKHIKPKVKEAAKASHKLSKPPKQCKAHKGPLPCIYCEDIVAEAIKYATKPVAHYTSTWTATENTELSCIKCNRPATHILAKLVKGDGVSVIDKANHHLFARCGECLPDKATLSEAVVATIMFLSMFGLVGWAMLITV